MSLPLGPADGDESVRLLNPLSAEDGYLRRRLLPGTGAAGRAQLGATTSRDVRLFEIGTVFAPAPAGERPAEERRLAAVLTGAREPPHWTGDRRATRLDLWDLKGLLEAAVALAIPGAAIQVEGNAWVVRDATGRVVGEAGPLTADAPPWAAPLFGFEVAIDPAAAAACPVRAPAHDAGVRARCSPCCCPTGLAAAQVGRRHPDVAAANCSSRWMVETSIAAPELPAGTRSVAFRLTFRAPDRTLRDTEVDQAESRLLAAWRPSWESGGEMRAPPAAEVTCHTATNGLICRAVADLEQVLRHVTEELAGWRRRTLKAEGELQEAKASGGVVAGRGAARGPPAGHRARDREPGAAPADRRRQGAAPGAVLAAGVPRASRRRERGVSTTAKNAVRVTIGGEEYTVRSELPPEYTREVAAYLDAALKRVRDSLPMVETHKAAILAALAITDELFQARRGDREVADAARRRWPTSWPGSCPRPSAAAGSPLPDGDTRRCPVRDPSSCRSLAGVAAGLLVALIFILRLHPKPATRRHRRARRSRRAAAERRARRRGARGRDRRGRRCWSAARMEALQLREEIDREIARRREEWERLERRAEERARAQERKAEELERRDQRAGQARGEPRRPGGGAQGARGRGRPARAGAAPSSSGSPG